MSESIPAQAILGGVQLNSKEWKSLGQPNMEALGLFRHASRISQGTSGCRVSVYANLIDFTLLAIVDVGVTKRLGGQVRFGMDL